MEVDRVAAEIKEVKDVKEAKVEDPEAEPRSRGITDLRLAVFAILVVVASFCFYIARPYSVISDIGYQAFSARQYVSHYTPVFNSLRLVDPRDLAKDIVFPLTDWAPSWTLFFIAVFKLGMSAGNGARFLAFLTSACGALGWVRVVRMVGLKGGWRYAGIFFAAVFCMRSNIVTKMGAGDPVIYAVAPWLIVAAAPLAVPLARAVTAHGAGPKLRKSLIARTALLCCVLGSVYWLKYSGIFLSVAILGAVLIGQFRGRRTLRTAPLAGILALYAASFLIPIAGAKAYNYMRSGSDLLEATVHRTPSPSAMRYARFLAEAAWSASAVLFSPGPGLTRIADSLSLPLGWLVRLPALALLGLFFYLMLQRPPTYIRNVALLCGLVPLVGFPALDFIGGAHFSFALGRCCEPFWILLELWVLALLSGPSADAVKLRWARTGVAVTATFQMILFLWVPWEAAGEAWKMAHRPRYQTGIEKLWDTDLSKYGTRDIDDRVHSLMRSPDDVIVPALYSDRGIAADTMLEFGGRLLPLTVLFPPLVPSHGREGANYRGTQPFHSSRPLRVILVATDPYNLPEFPAIVERIQRRFTQVEEWKPGPLDLPGRRTWIWTGEIH
jgi:hypothetical protein